MNIKAETPALILGSSSPRRHDLLNLIGLHHEIVKPDVEEVPLPGEEPQAYVLRNAREKGHWVADTVATRASNAHGFIVISADTIVVLGGKILEKPLDENDAVRMLRHLSGKSHTVISGVAIESRGHKAVGDRKRYLTVATEVTLKTLSDREITAYVKTGEPLDKAGGYAAQGVGSYMVKHINGSYANVVGLPVAEVVECLEQDFAFSIWR